MKVNFYNFDKNILLGIALSDVSDNIDGDYRSLEIGIIIFSIEFCWGYKR